MYKKYWMAICVACTGVIAGLIITAGATSNPNYMWGALAMFYVTWVFDLVMQARSKR